MSLSTKKSVAQIPLTAIVLAAGQGTRMKSPLPKILHPVAGVPMIVRIINTLKELGVQEIRVVCGPNLKLVESVIAPLGVQVKIQAQPRGTGDALKSAQVEEVDGHVLILNGDHPLVNAQDLKKAYSDFLEKKWDLMVVTAEVEDPGSLGRIVRSQGQLQAIVEAREASYETLKINEINTAIYFTSGEFLQTYLPKLQFRPEKQEYYLTDLVQIGLEHGEKIGGHRGTADLASGVNTQRELSEASKKCFYRKALELMEMGVLVWDPHNVYIEDSVEVGAGSVIWPQVFLRGQTKIGSFVAIEANSLLMDCQIGDGVLIRAHSYLEKVQVGNSASIGPFARLRPETFIGEGAHVGNFVEMKKVKFGKDSKAGHLTYLGDAVIGERVNVGCGTITCNYAVDRKKYETRIEDDVFVGSDSQFVAPVRVGTGAVIASGSTITKDVPARALAVSRGRQTNIESYVKAEGGDADPSAKAGE